MPAEPSYIQMNLTEALDEIDRARRSATGHLLVVDGETGSGRTSLAYRLVRHAESNTAFLVHPPDLDQDDAVAHALLQASRAARVQVRPEQGIEGNVQSLVDELSDRSERPMVVLRLPRSWMEWRPPNHANEDRLLRRARAFIAPWFRARELCVVVIPDRAEDVTTDEPMKKVRLGKAYAARDMLHDEEMWGPYASHAASLDEAIGHPWPAPSPVMLRLAVGYVALGAAPEHAASLLRRGNAPAAILSEILQRADSNLEAVLRRFAEIRTDVPVDWIGPLTGCPEEHVPLLTNCLGYDPNEELSDRSNKVRASSTIRFLIRKKLPSPRGNIEQQVSLHEQLANRYEDLDGATEPASLERDRLVYWLEKVHHLAHGGDASSERWSRQKIELPDMLCDRARALSRVQRKYEQAAELYRRIIEQDGRDAYAWHYLGYNLDRNLAPSEQVEKAYRKAVELEPANPWWNSRLVTFLIKRTQFRAATDAWENAISVIDPEGDRALNTSLPLHLHRWVALTWLAHGEVTRARHVIDMALPTSEPRLALVDHLVSDAEEALELGAAVRPSAMPIGKRWADPVSLSKKFKNKPLLRWFVGRVQVVHDTHVEIVFATTEKDPSKRQLLRKSMSLDKFEQLAHFRPDVNELKFIEIGEYGEEKGKVEIVIQQVSYGQLDNEPLDELMDLRRLEDWVRDDSTAE